MQAISDVDAEIARLTKERDSLKARQQKIAARLKALRVARDRLAIQFGDIASKTAEAEAEAFQDALSEFLSD